MTDNEIREFITDLSHFREWEQNPPQTDTWNKKPVDIRIVDECFVKAKNLINGQIDVVSAKTELLVMVRIILAESGLLDNSENRRYFEYHPKKASDPKPFYLQNNNHFLKNLSYYKNKVSYKRESKQQGLLF